MMHSQKKKHKKKQVTHDSVTNNRQNVKIQCHRPKKPDSKSIDIAENRMYRIHHTDITNCIK